MNKKVYYYIVSLIFLVVGVLHLARVVYSWDATISGVIIPLWVSWVAVIIAGYLAVRGYQFAQKYK